MKRTLVLLGLILLIGSNTVFSATATYSKGGSALFTFWLPDNWTNSVDGDVLETSPADESIYLAFWFLEDPNMDDLGEVVGEIFSESLEEYEITDEDDMEINGIPLSYFEGTGTDADGNELKASVAIFSPDGETFCTLFYFGTEESEETHGKELEKILLSITPAE